jgi:hypothetical protein
MTAEHDPGPAAGLPWETLIHTRESLARIEGRLEGVLEGYGTRFGILETGYAVHEQRLNDKGKQLARQDERLADLEEWRTSVDNDRGPRAARAIAVAALLIGLPGALLAFSNFMKLSGMTP